MGEKQEAKIRICISIALAVDFWKPEKLSLGAGRLVVVQPREAEALTRILALRRKRVNSDIHQ